MNDRNCWYIDEKGKKVLYLGLCYFKRDFSFQASEKGRKVYLYLGYDKLSKLFSDKEINSFKVEDLLRIIVTEDCSLLYMSEKPRKLKEFLGEKSGGIKTSTLYKYETLFESYTFIFI